MLNKLYSKILEILKENYKQLIGLIITMIVLTMPLPYYIDTPGGLIDISKRIEISDPYDTTGSLNLAYVSERKATIPTLIYAYFNKNWDVLKKNEVISDNETVELDDYRNHLLLDEANQNAIINGFTLAQEYVSVTNKKVNVIYVDLESETNLKIGDQIIKVNDKIINSKEDLFDAINLYKKGDILNFTVLNDGKESVKQGTLKDYDGRNLVGIVISETKDVKTNKSIKFNFEQNESGPSGGFMMALSIYNYLTEKDITHGMKIVGTGTIDELGNVGTIGGIEYKIKGAIKEKADLFFVPAGENYDKAVKLVEEENLDIILVKVERIQDAIDYLNNL